MSMLDKITGSEAQFLAHLRSKLEKAQADNPWPSPVYNIAGDMLFILAGREGYVDGKRIAAEIRTETDSKIAALLATGRSGEVTLW